MLPETTTIRGELYLSRTGWLLLRVPNGLGQGAFAALEEPGVELPISDTTGRYEAHISVMRPEELERIGGPERVTERGHRFGYTLGKIKTVNPAGWSEMERVWFIEVHSPELERLRRSYGLSSLPNNDKYRFHITFAVRRKGVLGRNDVTKTASSDNCPECGERYELRCRCRIGHKTCPNKHQWYACPEHPDVILRGSGHGTELGFGCHCGTKEAEERPIDLLLAAKRHSDRREYGYKHKLLRMLVRREPDSFIVDSPEEKFPGITHVPTNFRIHAPVDVARWIMDYQTKQGETRLDFLQQGFQTEPIVTSGLSSVLQYPQRAVARGLRYEREAAGQQRLADALDPQAAAEEWQAKLDSPQTAERHWTIPGVI